MAGTPAVPPAQHQPGGTTPLEPPAVPAAQHQPGGTTPLEPPAVPAAQNLAGELDGARLPDHRDPDLARVGQLVLDPLGHVPGDDLCLDVIDIGGFDHNPDLPPPLHPEAFLAPALARPALCQ